MKKFFGIKVKYGGISTKPGKIQKVRIQKVRTEQHIGSKPRIRKQIIAPLGGPVRRGRAYQAQYVRRGRRERGQQLAGHIRKRDVGADIPLAAPLTDPVKERGRGRTRETATVSIPQSPVFVPLEIFSVKSKKKKVRDNKAPLGVKRSRKQTGLFIY